MKPQPLKVCTVCRAPIKPDDPFDTKFAGTPFTQYRHSLCAPDQRSRPPQIEPL